MSNIFDWETELELELAARQLSPGERILSNGWLDFLVAIAPQISNPSFFHREYWEWYWQALTARKHGKPFPNGNTLFAVWSRSFGKCKAANTQIQLESGQRISIKDINVGDRVLSYNETTGQLEPDIISDKFISGKKQCYKITTQTGDRLTLTGEDRVYTFNGWKLVKDLQQGERIASPRTLPIIPTDFTHSNEEVKFLAYMLAEGSCSGKGRAIKAGFTNQDSVIVDDFYKCVYALGFTVRQGKNDSITHNVSSGVRRWLFDNGLGGKLSKDKQAPSWIFQIPAEQKWLFLSAFIDTDGYVVVRDGIGITLSSEQLIDDLRQLFLQVGVVTTKSYKPNDKAGAWVLRVDHEGMWKCVEHLKLILKDQKLKDWSTFNLYRYSLIDVYPRTVWNNLPKGINRMLRRVGLGVHDNDITRVKLRRAITQFDHDSWTWLEQAQVFWNHVNSVELVGVEDTYDVEVLNNHSLIAENLVTHNSTNSWVTPILEAALMGSGYCLYVSGDQRRATTHLSGIEGILLSDAVKEYFPELATQRKGVSGQTKQWKQEFIRTGSNYVFHAVGLDVGVRGTNVSFQRPSLIVLDDIDDLEDTPASASKKLDILTRSIIPAGTATTIIISAQNLIHEFGVINQIITGRVAALSSRRVSGPYPAIRHLETESRFINGTRRDIITKGNPTWPEVVDIAGCQQFIDNSGLKAFLAEYQHDLEGSREGLVIPEFNDDIHVITWSEFNRVYKLPPNNRRIPTHWQKQIGLDWGSSGIDKHACVASFLTMSAANSVLPGVTFLFKGLSFDVSPLVDDVAKAIINVMAPEVLLGSKDGIGERFAHWFKDHKEWTMFHASHEQRAMRDVLRIVYRLGVQGCDPKAAGGIDQMRHYLKLDMSEPHPFREGNGRAMWYWIVEDAQKAEPKNDGGLKLWREQFPRWRMKPTHLTDSGWQPEKPVKAFDDCGNCISGEALIETSQGQIPIKDVKVGDFVWTRQGLKRVLNSWMTSPNRPIYKVTFSNGATLEGTAEHPIWTENRGWIPLQCLEPTDILLTWQNHKSSLLTESNSTDTQMPNKRLTDAIINHMLEIKNEDLPFFTLRLGKQLMGQSQMDTTSTTRTGTMTTMICPTLNASQGLNISAIIVESEAAVSNDFLSWLESNHYPLRGIAPQKELSGTEAMPKRVSTITTSLQNFVKCVEQSLSPNCLKEGFALSIAACENVPGFFSAPLTESAFIVIEPSKFPHNEIERNIVQKAAQVCTPVKVESAGMAAVYDLEIEDAHEFFANGILVHNSLMMLTAHWSLTPTPLTAQQRFEAAMPEKYRYENLLKGRSGLSAEEELSYILMRTRTNKKLKRTTLVDEFGQPLS